MKVRLATLEDVPQIMELVGHVVPLMLATGNRQWDHTYPNPEVFERDIQLEQLWIAEDILENKIQIAGIAAITTDQQPEYANIGWDINESAIVVHRLAVDPAFRGRGIAEVLMRHSETVAQERGILLLRVDTNSQNAATQKLFPKLGYTLSGETEFSFRIGLRFLCYEKRLR